MLIEKYDASMQIQEWLGHESILETMDRYGHLFPNSLQQAKYLLDNHVIENLHRRQDKKMLA